MSYNQLLRFYKVVKVFQQEPPSLLYDSHNFDKYVDSNPTYQPFAAESCLFLFLSLAISFINPGTSISFILKMYKLFAFYINYVYVCYVLLTYTIILCILIKNLKYMNNQSFSFSEWLASKRAVSFALCVGIIFLFTNYSGVLNNANPDAGDYKYPAVLIFILSHIDSFFFGLVTAILLFQARQEWQKVLYCGFESVLIFPEPQP